jgi:hypothetical protein
MISVPSPESSYSNTICVPLYTKYFVEPPTVLALRSPLVVLTVILNEVKNLRTFVRLRLATLADPSQAQDDKLVNT